MTRGSLIVIDGSDGSGKATQTKLLTERLRAAGVPTETLDFPRYKDNQMGTLIGECIAGEHGDFLHIDPYIGSVLYAADRYESRDTLTKWLDAGHTVVLDRYVSANQIHQGGKIKDAETRTQFLEWLDRLEYGVFKLPVPDLTIYLHMPLDQSLELLKEKNALQKKDSYLAGGKRDTVELDRDYLMNAVKSAEFLMEKNVGWHMISCATDGLIRSREEIHETVYSKVLSAIKIPVS